MRFLETHVLPLLVQFEDIDAGGFVHHPNYLRFIERGRYQSLREIDFGFERQLADGQTFVVAEMQQRYLSPLAMGEEVFVVTRLVAVRKSSIKVVQGILRRRPTPEELERAGDDIFALEGIAFGAHVRFVYFDLGRRKAVEIPSPLRALLKIPDEPFFAANPARRDVRLLGFDAKNSPS
jgi:acyl-CoA thioester hydrolase